LAKIDAFLAAWDAYSDDNATGKCLTKDETKEAMTDAMRDFANTSIRYNKRMTEEQKLCYGIGPVDRTYTPAGEPETFPEAEADTSVIRQITIHFWDSATKQRAKPHRDGLLALCLARRQESFAVPVYQQRVFFRGGRRALLRDQRKRLPLEDDALYRGVVALL
jgi:hypothetical protein